MNGYSTWYGLLFEFPAKLFADWAEDDVDEPPGDGVPDGVVDIDAFSSDSKQNRKNKHAKKKRKIVNQMKTELMKEKYIYGYIICITYRDRKK